MLIRFFGDEQSLNEWREVVLQRVNKVVQPTSFKKDRYGVRFFADCELTQTERRALMQDWHSGRLSDGMQWNHCIAFEEVK